MEAADRQQRNIYLVGMPGAGKTTVGRQLARRLGRQFLDLDQEIEARTGVRIPVIFEFEGEIGFRKREATALEEISRESNLVVASGGGAVLRPENRDTMRRTGTVVYLSAEPTVLFERTRNDQNRPLLQVADPLAALRSLYQLRDPLYREIADLVVASPGGNPGRIVRRLEKEFNARCVN